MTGYKVRVIFEIDTEALCIEQAKRLGAVMSARIFQGGLEPDRLEFVSPENTTKTAEQPLPRVIQGE